MPVRTVLLGDPGLAALWTPEYAGVRLRLAAAIRRQGGLDAFLAALEDCGLMETNVGVATPLAAVSLVLELPAFADIAGFAPLSCFAWPVVSKAWHARLAQPDAWTAVFAAQPRSSAIPGSRPRLYDSYMRPRLAFPEYPDVGIEQWASLAAHIPPSLEVLAVEGPLAPLGAVTMHCVAPSIPRGLRELYLEILDNGLEYFCDEALCVLAAHIPAGLTTLSLTAGGKGLGLDELCQLVAAIPHGLRALHLCLDELNFNSDRWPRRVADDFQDFVHILADQLPPGLEKLRLRLEPFDTGAGLVGIGDAGARALCRGLPPSLLELDLDVCGHGLEQAGWEALAAALRSSPVLEVCRLDLEADKHLAVVAASLPAGLRELDMRGDIPSIGVRALAGRLPVGLATLRLDLFMSNLDEGDLNVLAQGLPPRLEWLQLHMFITSSREAGGLAALACHLPSSLRHLELSLSQCPIDDAGILSLAEHMPAALSVLVLDLEPRFWTLCPRLPAARALAAAVPATTKDVTLNFGEGSLWPGPDGLEPAAVLKAALPAKLRTCKVEC